MQIFSDAAEARDAVIKARGQGRKVGLVPTMGALHDGHLSLVKLAQQYCDETVATIFVNPTQFAPTDDLDKYPRTLEQDCEALAAAGVTGVFVPTVETMYPDGFSTFVDPPEVARSLEGVCRPGHFRGVTTVVMKLMNILPTTHAFFGRKDYQQLKVIETMVRDLDVGVTVIAGETIREPDGLALSSRNRYLNHTDRTRALLLSKALNETKKMIAEGERSAEGLQDAMRHVLLGDNDIAGVDKIDYAVVVNGDTLSQVDQIADNAVALIAAFVGETRLIDNITLIP